MRIAFLCPALEHGRDGVGDYTRRLAAELQRCGHDCLCVALNDRHFSRSAAMTKADHSSDSLLRFSSTEPWTYRWDKLDAVVREFQPHWLSLQFVPWGFHQKGLPFSLGTKIRRIAGGTPIHLMCHELWLQGRAFSIKQRFLGIFQKWVILRLFAALQPRVVNTTVEYYRDLLSSIGVSATLLPLHGNIPLTSSRAEGRKWLRSRLGLGESAVCFGFFGEIHASVDHDALGRFVRQRQPDHRDICVISAGQLTRNGSEAWHRITMACSEVARSFALGRLSDDEVSRYLYGLDVGLTSYSPKYVGKSGSVAAMLEHGLSVCLLGRSSREGMASDRSRYLSTQKGISVATTAVRLLESFSVSESARGGRMLKVKGV